MLTWASPQIVPTRADHTRAVVVAHDDHVGGGGQVDGVIVEHDDAGLGLMPTNVPARL